MDALFDGRGEGETSHPPKPFSVGFFVVLAILVPLVIALFLPSLGCSRCLSARSVCAVNLRGISQSMSVYAADNNGMFPTVPFAAYGSVPNAVTGSAVGTDVETLGALFGGGSRQAGSVQGCLWLLVVGGQVSPKQFVCRSDRFIGDAAVLADGSGKYFDGFQKPHQLSYSMAYPWNGDGVPAAFWKSTDDAGLPLLADMTPKQGTGMPARDVIHGPLGRQSNSGNHEGDGENVAFADAHTEFVRKPNVGQDNDNIYSMSGSPSMGPAEFGGIPAGFGAPDLHASKPPYDIIMLPVRDETTGGM